MGDRGLVLVLLPAPTCPRVCFPVPWMPRAACPRGQSLHVILPRGLVGLPPPLVPGAPFTAGLSGCAWPLGTPVSIFSQAPGCLPVRLGAAAQSPAQPHSAQSLAGKQPSTSQPLITANGSLPGASPHQPAMKGAALVLPHMVLPSAASYPGPAPSELEVHCSGAGPIPTPPPSPCPAGLAGGKTAMQ